MSYLLSHLSFLGLLFALLHSTGYLLDRRLVRADAAVGPPFVVRTALGTGAWIVLLFALATLGLLKAAAVYPIGVLVLAAAVVVAVRSRRGEPEPAERGAPTAGRWIAAGVVFLVLAALLVQAVSPEVSWDANTHRLLIPKLYVEAGGFRPIPFNVYSNWPVNTELLFALAMVVQDHVLAKLVHFLLGALLVAAVFRMTRRSAGPAAGWIAAALLLANEVVLFEMRVAYVDVAFAFFFFLAFAFLAAGLEDEDRAARWMLLAGLFSGIVAGIKLFGLFAAVALAGLLLVERSAPGLRRVGRARALALVLVPAAAMLVPWLVKSALYTGNPVYPFLWDIFGGPHWSADLDARHVAWHRGIGMGRSALDYLLLPVRVILEGGTGYERFDGRIHAAWIALVPLSVAGAFRNALARRCLTVALVYFVLWAASSQQMRFLIPVLPLAAVAASVSAAGLLKRLRPGRAQTAAGALVSVLAAGILLQAAAGTLSKARERLGVYLEHDSEMMDLAVHPTFQFINEQLPSDAKLLFLNTNHGFFCRRDFVADSFFEASQLAEFLSAERTKEAVRARLRDLGVTHILFEHKDWGIPFPPALVELLEDPGSSRPIHRAPDNRYTVLEVP